MFTSFSWVDKNPSQLQAELLVTSLCRPLLNGGRTSLNFKLLSCISSPYQNQDKRLSSKFDIDITWK